ncbi:MAG: phytoene/squalene synthase family protein [Verrucomicrobiota bacterium]|jgi:farnesyl-diphosphate farnesyltransferase
MPTAQKELLGDLLKATSRSFYLTLRVLPARVRPQIGLAYLLARTTDTISDTELVPLEQRLDALHKLRERILGSSTAPLNFGELAKQQGSPAERVLLEKAEDSLTLLPTFSPADLKLVRDVLTTIMGGQELDLRRFAGASAEKIVALETAVELDDYTYRVAGCVGEFWTKMCRAHLFPNAKLNDSFIIEFGERDVGVERFFKRLDDSFLIQLGVRLGKGLQLVNILRDLPADLHKGRCYLPTERLDAAGLIPEVLLSPANEKKFLPLFHGYLDKAEAHLAAGWTYTNTLPFGQFRVRLACAWPILIGVRTIEKLRAANVIELQQRVKVSREEVRGIVARSILASPFPKAWRNLLPSPGKAVASGGKLA